ncbi:MAG: FAD/NAD(P)-binding protein, partial [Calditrichia bacterium]
MKNITVIGAGLSGTLLIINLLRQRSREDVRIRWIDRRNESDLGPAYSTGEDYLLNVPCEIMGAFSNQPDHFLNWCRKQNIAAEKGDYLPRKLYRRYIQAMLRQAKEQQPENISLERIQGEVENIQFSDRGLLVVMQGGDSFPADKIVLALGNAPPRHPRTRSRDFINDRRYVQNPWKHEVFSNLSPDETIVFIGSGQTMVDLVTGLQKRKHRGKMIAISRRGVLPFSQAKLEPYPSFFEEELQGQTRISNVFRSVRKHIRIAAEKGLDPRAVIDSLRSHTPALWMQLPPAEKRRFLRHVFRYWEILRSRIPPQSEKIIKELKTTGQLRILA